MKVYSANSWIDTKEYISKKKKQGTKKNKNTKVSKAAREKRIQDHNLAMTELSTQYAKEMETLPSELEKRMQQFLDNHNIHYQFQKVFDIKKKNGYIRRFYIADFYIPSKNLIIETDGAFHDNQVKEDIFRTKQIVFHYPNMKVIRWRWHDFDSDSKKAKLLKEVM